MKTLKGYIRYMRKQPKHMQHIHAVIFAGTITTIIAAIILYTDYGFWHEKYNRSDDLLVGETSTTTNVASEPPSEMFSRFWNEAKVQISNIGTSTTGLLEGKEVYQR